MSKERLDIHQVITDRIITSIEAGAGEWRMPWHRGTGGARPVNAATGKAYQGINILALWVEAQVAGFGSNVWGTYRQWSESGCQVRKGAKASHVVFYKQIELNDADTADEESPATRLFARATPVFNADQVDGYTAPVTASPEPAQRLETIDAFIANTGADLQLGGTVACYIPSEDRIRLPSPEAFFPTETSSATECFYSTALHELVHWTGAEGRCGRELASRFKTEAYAVEELIAELGAAFLCADLGITAEPRDDHAQYIASWLKVLKSDKRAVFTAASAASKAAAFLHSLQEGG